MNEIAWYPKGMAIPTGLTAVWLKPGTRISEGVWLSALEDRVVNLLLEEYEEDQMPLAKWACNLLEVPSPDSSDQIAQFILKGNLELQTLFNLAVIDQDPFVGTATQEIGALIAMEETNFQLWVELAASQQNPHNLD